MDDLEALCSEVTILSAGRVVLSGPLGKLSAENDEFEHRILTSDPDAARRIILRSAGLHLLDRSDVLTRQDSGSLVVRAATPALDDLVRQLVLAGIAVRELTPVVSPLESAFLALTEQEVDR